ncbi:MAG: hypothetical protein QM644_08180 [Mobilitalea sp.]
MKQQKRISILLVLLTMLLLISGCSKQDSKKEFSIGSWNDNVFENTWLNMKFEIGDDWAIATDEEISEVMGVGAELISELNGTSKEALEMAAELKVIYGFLAYNSDTTTNIQLMYENLAKSLGGTKYTETEYLGEFKKQIPEDIYELVDESTKEIAGKTFYTLKYSVYDGALFQEYYTYKLDKYMVSLIVTYTSETEAEIQQFLNNISTIKE